MIYFDHSATTPVDRRVVAKMRPFFSVSFGNPSSSHTLGQEAKQGVNKARRHLASFLNCGAEEIVFTPGGTEANNLALKGIDAAHTVSTETEHHSVINSLKDKETDLTLLKPGKSGLIGPKSVREAIRPETRLVSIIYGNNETGAIQPIREIGKTIEKINRKREEEDQIFFHTDAVQTIEYLNCDIKYLHVDLLSLSAHKFYGPKGIGALYLSQRVPLSPIITGGSQELGRWAGTENTPGIIGLGEAIRLVEKEGQKNSQKIKELRDYFEKRLKAEISEIKINSAEIERLPGSSSVVFARAEGESILLALDLKGIAVSTGSACASHDLKPSHVLTAIGLSTREAQSTIRFSFGKDNTKGEIEKAIKELKTIIKRLRKISPKY